MFKGKVPMRKVNWGAKNDYEFVKNYKVLQSVFDKHKIQKHIPVNKLIRAKYQDNLEWLQWLKCYYESNMGEDEAADYNAESRRSRSKGAPKASKREKKAVSSTTASSSASKKRSTKTTKSVVVEKENNRQRSQVDGKKSKRLEKENAELRLTVEGLEKERDFYFQKLRDVELLMQQEEEEKDVKKMKEEILKILYAEDGGEEDGGAAEETAAVVEKAEEVDMLY